MPVGDIPGWRQVFADDFTSGASMKNWAAYDGHPAGDPGGLWSRSHVVVSNNMLVLRGYRDPVFGNAFVTGGVGSVPGIVQTYGKYLVRYRIDVGRGIAHTLHLWPTQQAMPPEVDFAEDNGKDRQLLTTSFHHTRSGPAPTLRMWMPVDLTKWNIVGVEWSPGKIVYTINGVAWGTIFSTDYPTVPMKLAIQSQAWNCGQTPWEACPDSTTPSEVDLQDDWVVAYAPTP
jgi:beta-glucanase (GH16 family)